MEQPQQHWGNLLSLALFSLDSNGCFDSCTKTFCEYLRTAESQLMGKHLAACFDPSATCAINGGLPQEKATLEVPLDTEKKQWGRLILAKNGNGWLGQLLDITKEKSFEQNELWLKHAESLAQIGVWDWNMQTGDTVWSDQMYEIYGLTKAEFSGKGLDSVQMTHPDDLPLLQARIGQRAIESEKGEKMEKPFIFRIIRKDGEIRHIQTEGSIILDEEGNPARLMGVAQDVTSWVKNEQKLKESKDKLEFALNAASLGYFDWDMDSNDVFWDHNLCEIYGIPEDFQGNKNDFFMSIVHPNDVPKVATNMEKYIMGQKTHTASSDDYRIISRNGAVKYIITWAKVFFRENGQPYRLVGICQDITDRREIEIALQQSEGRYRSVLEAMSEGIVVQDANGNITNANKAAEDILGITVSQMEGRSSMDPSWRTIHDDGTAFDGQDHPAMATLATGLAQKNVIMGVYKPNGKLSWISINSEPLWKDSGELLGVVATFTDITQHKEAEDEIRKLAMVAQQTDNAVIIANRHGYIEWVNNSFTSITGYTLEEVRGRLPSEILHEKGDERALEDIWRALSHKEAVKTEMVNYKKNGEAFWAEISIRPVLNAKGRIEKFMTLQSDITERKRKEEEIQRQNEELKKTNEELDNFVYRVSHDLRAPISSALGLVSLMQSANPEEPLSTYTNLQEKSLKKLDLFIKDILDYSRNARMKVAPEPIDLPSILNDIFSQLEYLDDVPHLAKIIQIEGNIPFYSDKQRLVMLFNNLISNAFRFKRPYEAAPFVRIKASIAEKLVTIEVEDNGIGIAKVHLTRIFDMFYRASDSRTGSGLGLYIVKEAVEKLQGKISVVSEIGKGTVFRLELPNMAV